MTTIAVQLRFIDADATVDISTSRERPSTTDNERFHGSPVVVHGVVISLLYQFLF